MTERNYQDAVQVLKDRLGSQWEGVETDGRSEMVSVLKHQLGYDSRTANDAIDAMIESGTLPMDKICTHQLPLEQFQEGLDLVAAGDRSVKVSLIP